MPTELIRAPGDRGPAGLAVIVLAVIVGFILFITGGPLRTVPAGHVGVKDFFGQVSSTVLSPGINVVVPLTRVVKMSVQTQEVSLPVILGEK